MAEPSGLRLLLGGASGGLEGGFEVGYVAEDGTDCRITLLDAGRTRFEWCRPARRFRQYKGQKHMPGRWWTAKMGCHVGYESWLERDLNRNDLGDARCDVGSLKSPNVTEDVGGVWRSGVSRTNPGSTAGSWTAFPPRRP
jgi:hypothetical protein